MDKKMKCMVCEGSGIFKDECCAHCFGYGQVKNWIENLIPNEKIQPSDFIFYSEIKNFMASRKMKYSSGSLIGLDEEINEFVSWAKKIYKLKNFVMCHEIFADRGLILSCIVILPYKDNHVTFLVSIAGSEAVLLGWFDPSNKLGERK